LAVIAMYNECRWSPSLQESCPFGTSLMISSWLPGRERKGENERERSVGITVLVGITCWRGWIRWVFGFQGSTAPEGSRRIMIGQAASYQGERCALAAFSSTASLTIPCGGSHEQSLHAQSQS
jgi:hypothetical protein